MPTQTQSPLPKQRLRIRIEGAVQGVGFRPFVYRLAQGLSLSGWVENAAQGVVIEAEGTEARLKTLLERIRDAAPVHSLITNIDTTLLETQDKPGFEIRQSRLSGKKSADILPDLAPCASCLQELFDPLNRRYHYPFINCTHCGPRFSIIESIPYDRSRTTMKAFEMCAACASEYHDPNNRRFHAQPNACADCGPQLAYWDEAGKCLAEKDAALFKTVAALRAGKIIAMKGIGGFHLMVDATNNAAVARLRKKKQRPTKPFALLYGSLEDIKKDCTLSEPEAKLLLSQAAPIVLVKRRDTPLSNISRTIAPGNPDLGVMLCASPLHHLLMRMLDFPLLATSGNLSNEPICTDETEAVCRLKGIAEVFLIHNRPIVRPLEDSLLFIVAGRKMTLRRGRGLPLFSVPLEKTGSSLLALGGQLKNSVALVNGKHILLGPHIGNLETVPALKTFRQNLKDLQELYAIKACHMVCDLHPDYYTTHHAKTSALPHTAVQHHHAHIAACMAEHGLTGAVLGVAWDGTGFGVDDTLWGGEFLRASPKGFSHLAHLRAFPLPGGTAAIREPRRAALGLLYSFFGEDVFEMSHLLTLSSFSAESLNIIKTMLNKNVNSPQCSSAGRLFDVVSSLLGIQQRTSFEGEAAMALEFAARPEAEVKGYAFAIDEKSPLVIDWGPMVYEILRDLEQSVPIQRIAKRFHVTLSEIIVKIAVRAKVPRIVLSGGCFQNRLLVELTVHRLKKAGFEIYWPQDVPPNDGGIALGQAFVATHQLEEHFPCV